MRRYKHNPFIESLPTINSDEELIKLIRFYPEINIKRMSEQERTAATNDVMRYFEPLTRTIELITHTLGVIKEGYFLRTPQKVIDFNKNGGKVYTNFQNDFEDHLQTVSFNLTFTLIGDPGMGKSKAFEKLKVILPPFIRQKAFNTTQVPLVHFECPPRTNIKQLLVSLLSKLDQILKTQYTNDSKSMNTTGLINFVNRLCQDHLIGAIVIDEIHNLKVNTPKEMSTVLEFIKSFSNIIKTPLIVIGTFEAQEILFSELQTASRLQGTGAFEWPCYVDPEADDYEDWEFYLESLWEVQVLNKPGKLTNELKSVYTKKSDGVIRLVNLLHMLAQQVCLKMKRETITAEILELASRKKMFATENLVLARQYHREQNKINHSKIQDILDSNPYEEITSSAEFREIQKQIIKVFPKVRDEAVEETIISICRNFPDLRVKEKIIKTSEVIENLTSDKISNTFKKKFKPKGELIEMIKNYNEDSASIHQIFEERGIIKSPYEILNI